eukprot:scaffold45902_cov30-Prasinocladus_malaysianus.AAC.1
MVFESLLRVASISKLTPLALQMCSYAFQLLNYFLSSNHVTLLLLYVINERLRLDVQDRPPLSMSTAMTEDEDEGFGLLSMGEAGVAGREVTAANSQTVRLGLLKVRHSCKLCLAVRTKDGFHSVYFASIRGSRMVGG